MYSVQTIWYNDLLFAIVLGDSNIRTWAANSDVGNNNITTRTIRIIIVNPINTQRIYAL